MKHIDYLYFNIYSYCYRLSQYRESFNTRIQTMYLFSLGSGGWLLLFESIYLHFVKHHRFNSRFESILFALAIYGLTAMMFHYIFIVKDRDQKIVDKFVRQFEENPNRKWHLGVSLGILALPYLVLMAFALCLPRHLA
ncbi:MAG TPA: hypothetical protein VG101_13425 [Puia sp.]|nr:hypothetical protein [Puia sp.]